VDDVFADAKSDQPRALAMDNVRTVHSRLVNDVNAFLQAADAQVLKSFGFDIAKTMKDDEREKDEANGGRWKPKGPAEPGWVVEIRGYTDHDKGRVFVEQALLRNLQRTEALAEASKGDQKVGDFIVGAKDPVGKDGAGKPRISHAFVYHVFAPIPDPAPGVLPNIARGSFLDAIVGGGGAQGGQAGGTSGSFPGGADFPTGKPSPGATPGGASSSLGPPPSASVPGVGTGTGTGAGTAAPEAPNLAPAWTPLGRTGGAAQPVQVAPPKSKDEPTRRRYEFVVMLVWREPTPSGTAAPAAAPSP
jgi:hypothetical protein